MDGGGRRSPRLATAGDLVSPVDSVADRHAAQSSATVNAPDVETRASGAHRAPKLALVLGARSRRLP